jgi:hypothetical protein
MFLWIKVLVTVVDSLLGNERKVYVVFFYVVI